MLGRTILAIVGLVELIAPKRFANFWFGLATTNPEEIELKPWVLTAIRIEGLLLLAIVLWRSRESIENRAGANFGFEDVPAMEYESDEEDADVETDADVTNDESVAAEDTPAGLRGDTTRFKIAAVLYHADDPMAVSEVVDLSEETDWEVGRSTASATLYRMYRDDLVDRQEREDSRGYAYWLTDDGETALEAADEPIEPNPFSVAE